jgi:hypothetical protein
MHDEEHPAPIICGGFRIKVFPSADSLGIGAKRGYRAQIAGNWQGALFDTVEDAKWDVAENGLAVIEPLYKELKKLHAKSKNRSR